MEYCLFTEPQQGATYDDQLAFALAGERLGFDGFFRSDHYLRMGGGDPLPGPTDAWTTLAGLAREIRANVQRVVIRTVDTLVDQTLGVFEGALR